MTPPEAAQSPYRQGNWTVIKLKEELRKRDLSPVGNKDSLIGRLEKDDRTQIATPIKKRRAFGKATPHPKSKSPSKEQEEHSRSPTKSKSLSRSPSKGRNSSSISPSKSPLIKSKKSPEKNLDSSSKTDNVINPFEVVGVDIDNSKSFSPSSQSQKRKKYVRRSFLDEGTPARSSGRVRRPAVHKNELSEKKKSRSRKRSKSRDIGSSPSSKSRTRKSLSRSTSRSTTTSTYSSAAFNIIDERLSGPQDCTDVDVWTTTYLQQLPGRVRFSDDPTLFYSF